MRKVALLVLLEASVMSGWELVDFPTSPLWRILSTFGLAIGCALILYLPEIKAWVDPVERIMKKLDALHGEVSKKYMRKHIREILDNPRYYGVRIWNSNPIPRFDPSPRPPRKWPLPFTKAWFGG